MCVTSRAAFFALTSTSATGFCGKPQNRWKRGKVSLGERRFTCENVLTIRTFRIPDTGMHVARKPLKKRTASKVIAITKGSGPDRLVADLRQLIQNAREGVTQVVNSALVLVYWEIGHRIRRDVLQNRRAEYGEEILPTLSAKLVPEFGQGYS
jgi:hypothetical protein